MRRETSSLTLLVVALAAALLWRLEVELCGWEGLIWVSYFHWAIPAGILMFSVWLAVFSTVQPLRRRILFVFAFIAFAAVAYQLTYASIMRFYTPIFGSFSDFPWWFVLQYFSIFLIVPLIPIFYLTIAKLFGAPITIRHVAISLGFYALSFPTAIFLLEIVNHRGSSDMLHAIKSGFVIPFLIISFGIVFVLKNDQTGSNKTD